MSAAHAVVTKNANNEAAASRNRKNTQYVPEIILEAQTGFLGEQFPVQRKENACACGGGCPRCVLQAKHTVSGHTGRPVQRQAVPEEEEEEPVLQGKFDPSDAPAQAANRTGMPGPLKAGLEALSGMDLSGVRVHHNSSKPAQVDALAYTQGQNIHLGPGQEKHLPHEGWHAVQQMQGRVIPTMHAKGVSLNDDADLEREADVMGERASQVRRESTNRRPDYHAGATSLSTVIRTNGSAEPPFQRKCERKSPAKSGGLPRIIQIAPNVEGLKLGERLTIPAALRVASMGEHVLDIGAAGIVFSMMDRIDLHTWTREGVPPGRALDPKTQARIALVNSQLQLSPTSGEISGWAKLSIGSDYPPHLITPTVVDAQVRTTGLGRLRGRIGYGPLAADFTMKLQYDTTRIKRAIEPATSGTPLEIGTRLAAIVGGVTRGRLRGIDANTLRDWLGSVARRDMSLDEFQECATTLLTTRLGPNAEVGLLLTALRNLANELAHPGFRLTGSAGFDPWGLLGGVRLPTGFRASAPTTVPRKLPLLTAPTSFPISYLAGGVIPTPPGSLFDVPALGIGATGAAFGERTGGAFTAAFLPRLDPDAISEKLSGWNKFPVHAYVELSGVTRVSEGLELGLRFTAQISTAELFGSTGSGKDPEARHRALVDTLQGIDDTSPELAKPNIGATLFGRF